MTRGVLLACVIGICTTGPYNWEALRQCSHLEQAKEIARGMTIINDLDNLEHDARAFCMLLRWPSCRPVSTSSNKHATNFENLTASLDAWPGMSTAVLADIVDAGALSIEFYYFARELIRSNHRALGLGPGPPSSLLPAEMIVPW